ncbi:MAG: hypothetical protein ACI4WG_00810 [Erysipelotrichaceae bacterium]
MLKALISKQLSELFQSLFGSSKKNKKSSMVSKIALLVFLFLCFMYIFSVVAFPLAFTLVEYDVMWLYFTVMSITAIVFSTFTNMFTASSAVYGPKDNDILLAMPIPLNYIVVSRVVSVMIMACIYVSLVYIPTIVCYFLACGFSVGVLIGSLISFVTITVIVFALSCILGYVVAVVSSKIHGNNFIKVGLTMVFFAFYYWGMMKIDTILNEVLESLILFANTVTVNNLLYLLGNLPFMNLKSLLITPVAFILAIIVIMLLAKSFVKIIYSEKVVHRIKTKIDFNSKKPFAALLYREFARFASSATYMLNCSMSTIMLPILIVLAVVNSNVVIDMLVYADNALLIDFILLIIAIVICAVGAMNDCAVCSTSLEGENIWIVQSLPCKTKDVLFAKLVMQWILTIPVVLAATIATCIILPCDLVQAIILHLFVLAFMVFFGFYALFLGVSMANIHWVNEISAIKQSANVMIYLFSSWLIIAATVAPYFVFGEVFDLKIYLLLITCLLLLISFGLYYWTIKKGVKKFESL